MQQLEIPDINEGMTIKSMNVIFFENVFRYKINKEVSSNKRIYEVTTDFPPLVKFVTPSAFQPGISAHLLPT